MLSDVKVYAAWNNFDNIRSLSSSGGIFSILAEKVLNQNGIVYGVAMDYDLNAYHIGVNSIEQLSILRGSKYIQSDIKETFKETKSLLEQDKNVLFSGTPCQISGLKNYLQKDYEKLITCDLVCHGTPSKEVFKKYINTLETQYKSKAIKINFRDKTEGWKKFSVVIEFNNGQIYRKPLNEDYFMRLFLSDICLRESCYRCNLKLSGDITLGDFWGMHEIKPEIDDDKGISLMLVNTNKGQKYLEEIKNNIFLKEFSFDEAIRWNKCIVSPVKRNEKTDAFWNDFEKLDVDKLIKKYTTRSLIKRYFGKVKYYLKVIYRKIFK